MDLDIFHVLVICQFGPIFDPIYIPTSFSTPSIEKKAQKKSKSFKILFYDVVDPFVMFIQHLMK